MDNLQHSQGTILIDIFLPYVLNFDPNFWVRCNFARMVTLMMRTTWTIMMPGLQCLLSSATTVGTFYGLSSSSHHDSIHQIWYFCCSLLHEVHISWSVFWWLFICTCSHNQHLNKTERVAVPSAVSSTPLLAQHCPLLRWPLFWLLRL